MKSYTQLLDRLISEAAVIYPGEFSDLYARIKRMQPNIGTLLTGIFIRLTG